MTRQGPIRWAAGLMAAALVLTACGGNTEGGNTDGGDTANDTTTTTASPEVDAFPVTIPHAFGETTIDAQPTRVVAWGWATADALVALDVIPVAIPFQAYGGDDEGVLPWIREALEGAGHEIPTVLPDSAEPPFEAIAAANPDLILAPYSGITEQDYELLSEIAPTVAYPEQAWATPWRETIRIVATAVGKTAEAEALLSDIDAEVAEAGASHPEIEGKSVAVVWPTPDTFYVYKPADPRVQFVEDLGFESAQSVTDLGVGGETFYFTLSFEQLDQLTSDVVVVYGDTQEGVDEFLASDAASLMPQVASGGVATVVGQEFIASVSPPTALSLTWGLDEYVAIVAEAAARVEAG